ncbi:MAG: caspase family protein [Pseudomonadota bacterium]
MSIRTCTTAARRLTIALAALLFAATGAKADVYGLVIGIDKYQHLPSLAGAVNDARDIDDALRTMGAKKVIMLLDGEATRERILQSWRELTDEAAPGDTIVFSYAGHGGQEPEKVVGSEDDRLDETFQLAGFQNVRPGNAERILDNEINLMFAKARHLKIIFVADSCHSGTMTRSFDSRSGVLRTRLGGYGAIVDDPLPPPTEATASLNPEDLDNIVYFGAVRDDQVVQEIKIDQKPRGALSWSFARALRGRADLDRNGAVNTQELAQYVTEAVRTRSAGRQHPQMTPRGKPAEISLAVGSAGPDPFDRPAALSIVNLPSGNSLEGAFTNVTIAAQDNADLIWDYASGDVITSDGDVIAHLGPQASAANAQAIVDKWLLLRDLGQLAESNPMSVRVEPSDKLHRSGQQIAIQLSGHKHPNLVAFNLAVDGTVQFLIPTPNDPDPRYHGKLREGQALRFPLKVVPPFGADHLVALSVPAANAELIKGLKRLNNRKAAGKLRTVMRAALENKTFQLGFTGIFTAN